MNAEEKEVKNYYLKEFSLFEWSWNFEKWLGEQRHKNNVKTKRRIGKIYDSKIWQTICVLVQ